MNSIYHILVRRFSTDQSHYKLLVVGAGCGGLACASKFAKKLSKDQIAIVDKTDVTFVLSRPIKCLFCFLDAYLSTGLDISWSWFENTR